MWSMSFGPLTLDTLRTFEKPGDPAIPRDQFDAARAAAVAIVESGAVGDPTRKSFRGVLGGEVNPNHEPAKGDQADSVTVVVSQVGSDEGSF